MVVRIGAEKANDLPIWEVVSTRGEWPACYRRMTTSKFGTRGAAYTAISLPPGEPIVNHGCEAGRHRLALARAYAPPAVNRRQDVIDAAVSLLRESGPAALTSNNVAARLGVTQPAIYRHIRGMDELVTLASQAVVAELTVAMTAALDAPETEWGDGTHLTQFGRRICELIATRTTSFEVLDRWRFDGGELGMGIRSLLDAGRGAIADVLEDQWRHNFAYTEPFDGATKNAQLAHAQLIEDDVIIVSRIIRESTAPQPDAEAARLLGLRIFSGWYAYVHDITRRCGLPAPRLDDDTLRVPDLSEW